jgi:hypothetical protein
MSTERTVRVDAEVMFEDLDHAVLKVSAGRMHRLDSIFNIPR